MGFVFRTHYIAFRQSFVPLYGVACEYQRSFIVLFQLIVNFLGVVLSCFRTSCKTILSWVHSLLYGAKCCVLERGIRGNHPALKQCIWNSLNVIPSLDVNLCVAKFLWRISCPKLETFKYVSVLHIQIWILVFSFLHSLSLGCSESEWLKMWRCTGIIVIRVVMLRFCYNLKECKWRLPFWWTCWPWFYSC